MLYSCHDFEFGVCYTFEFIYVGVTYKFCDICIYIFAEFLEMLCRTFM